MPIKSCTLPNGKKGFKWGDRGKCYASRSDAVDQGQAAHAAGYKKAAAGQVALDGGIGVLNPEVRPRRFRRVPAG